MDPLITLTLLLIFGFNIAIGLTYCYRKVSNTRLAYNYRREMGKRMIYLTALALIVFFTILFFAKAAGKEIFDTDPIKLELNHTRSQ